MSKATDILQAAQQKAMANRPKVGGFPYLAETLRQAGILKNIWSLPSCQSIYVMDTGDAVVQQGAPLVTGLADIAKFDEKALIAAIRIDQAGESTFGEFLMATWQAGVVWYEADFTERKVTYGGLHGETYVESYPEVVI